MPKSYWVRPGAPPAQWLKARRRVLTEEMQGNLLPSNVVEAMGPLSSLIRLVSSNDHREQIRNELYPLLREALQGGDPLRADAPKACRTSLVCGVKQCGGSKTGATHHILCKTYSARSGTVKEVNAAIKEYLPDLTARSAQAKADLAQSQSQLLLPPQPAPQKQLLLPPQPPQELEATEGKPPPPPPPPLLSLPH